MTCYLIENIQHTVDQKSNLRDKGHVQLLMEPGAPSHSYTGCHLPYGITQCYPPPDTSEYSRP